ncbi:MAG TPA: L,D-transpeptidase family protein [Pyrinomonadaceae bacterium]|nr:L,D-transpeptidase family protein [Pyrinomonadaceae bacterium]
MKRQHARMRLGALASAAVLALTCGIAQRDDGRASVASATSPVERATVATATPTQGIDNSVPLKLPLARPRVLVLKARRQLILFDGERALRLYRIGLGTSPVGDKVREGDRRTPEGDFYVCVKNPQSAFYLSLGLSYPNEEHAARGLRDRLITRSEHARITRALRRKRTPPWTTALGGEIFIHGRGSQSDWTWGCVALDDADMRELYDALPTGTPVRIEP